MNVFNSILIRHVKLNWVHLYTAVRSSAMQNLSRSTEVVLYNGKNKTNLMVCYFWNRASIACVFLFCFYRKMKFSTMSIVRIVENVDSTRDVHESRGQLVSISPDSVRTPILRWVCIINEQRVDQLVFGSDFAVCTLLLSSSFLPDKSSSFLAWTENGKVKDVDEMMKHQKCEKLP